MCLSLKNSHMPKKHSMGYAKKGRERKEKYPWQKGMREKNECQRAWRKEKKKRKNKIAHTFE